MGNEYVGINFICLSIGENTEISDEIEEEHDTAEKLVLSGLDANGYLRLIACGKRKSR